MWLIPAQPAEFQSIYGQLNSKTMAKLRLLLMAPISSFLLSAAGSAGGTELIPALWIPMRRGRSPMGCTSQRGPLCGGWGQP